MEWFPSLLLQCFLAAFRCFHGISYKTVRWLYRSSTASDIFPFPLFLSVSYSRMLAYQRRGKRDLVFGIGDSSRIALRITLCQWLLVRDTTLLINCMTLSTWNETFDVLYECLDISSLAPPLHIVDPKVISLLFPFRFHLDGFKMDKSLSQYTIGVYFTLQLMPCYSLIGVFAWMNNIISWDSGERERKKRKVENILIFPVRNFSSLVLILFAIQLLWTCFISAIRFRIRTNQDTSKEITVIFRVHVLIREWVLFLTLRVGLVPCPPPMGPTPYPQVPVADFLPVSQPELKVANKFY